MTETETTTLETTPFTLTKEHLKALRTADSICFDHYKGPKGGTGKIRAIKRTPKDIWEKEKTIEVPAVSTVRGYGTCHERIQVSPDTISCFDMAHSAQYDEELQTILSLLRVGDEIEMVWVAGGGNGYVKRARVTEKEYDTDGKETPYQPGLGEMLYHDKLYIRIRRNDKPKYFFHYADSICPNNTARMIRGL